MSHSVLGTRAIGGQVTELARVSALECVGSLPGPEVSCGTKRLLIVSIVDRNSFFLSKMMEIFLIIHKQPTQMIDGNQP